MLHSIIDFILASVDSWGYFGIFSLMFLESSFFPFPSEVVIIPAGYLVFEGKMSGFWVVFFGVLGSLAGAWFNYVLAYKFGRGFLEKFISKQKLDKMDKFFDKHGAISMFTGRLLPVFRQYISFPAGLSKMNGFIFSVYTLLGSLIWIIILTVLGYYIGDNKDLIDKYLNYITIGIIVFLSFVILIYYKIKKK